MTHILIQAWPRAWSTHIHMHTTWHVHAYPHIHMWICRMRICQHPRTWVRCVICECGAIHQKQCVFSTFAYSGNFLSQTEKTTGTSHYSLVSGLAKKLPTGSWLMHDVHFFCSRVFFYSRIEKNRHDSLPGGKRFDINFHRGTIQGREW